MCLSNLFLPPAPHSKRESSWCFLPTAIPMRLEYISVLRSIRMAVVSPFTQSAKPVACSSIQSSSAFRFQITRSDVLMTGPGHCAFRRSEGRIWRSPSVTFTVCELMSGSQTRNLPQTVISSSCTIPLPLQLLWEACTSQMRLEH